MAKEELLEFDGTVTEVLPDGNFRVKLDNEHEVLAYTAGKMRKFRIRTGVGDRVVVEMSPYDLQRGRISFRHCGRRWPEPMTGGRSDLWRKLMRPRCDRSSNATLDGIERALLTISVDKQARLASPSR